ncbi:hypothetical protein [Microcoleus sp.]|uniref:hypothetical protein n=1 Tax=Microcoleus sp. TaxID=44472 RepID=UPI00352345D9
MYHPETGFIAETRLLSRVHLNLVRAKHSGIKSLAIANKLSAVMLRPYEDICQNEMHLLSL